MFSREDLWRREPLQSSGATQYYSFLCLPGPGGWRTLVEAEAKIEVGANFEESKQREDKQKDKVYTTPIHAHVSKQNPGKYCMPVIFDCFVCALKFL